MNSFKDKVTERERLYVFLVPLLFLIVYGLFLISFLFSLDVEVEINGQQGVLINILGAAFWGYTLSAECTIIHYLLNLIRRSNTIIKILLSILFLPFLLIGLVPAYIGTIPYCIYSSNKIKRIQIDNKGVYSKGKIISLTVFLIIDLIITIIYFALNNI